MQRYFKLGNPLALLYASEFESKADVMKALYQTESNGEVKPNITFLEIETAGTDDASSYTYKVESAAVPSASQTGSLFFTSGTSGTPKGVVHSYQALLASARERIATWKLTENDVVLNQKPGNWMGGIFGIIPSLISGACL